MSKCIKNLAIFGCALAIAGTAGAQSFSHGHATPTTPNDYPTVTRADYIFACMASNGQTRQVLEQCACSIDHIASILPYERYVEAETVLRTLQVGGEKVSPLRSSPAYKKMVEDLRRAQAEADILCFN